MAQIEPTSGRLVRFAAATAVLPLGLYAVLKRLNWFSVLPHPNSTDAYFYLQEFRSWSETGAGYYERWDLFFFLASLVGRILSLNEEQLFFTVAVIGLLLLSTGFAILVNNRERWLIPLAFLLPWVSDIVFFRHIAFLRQGFSVGLAVFGASLIVRSKRGGRGIGIAAALGVLFLAAGCAMHTFTASAFSVFTVAFVFLSAVSGSRTRGAIAGAALLATLAGYLLLSHGSDRAVFGAFGDLAGQVERLCLTMDCSSFERFELYSGVVVVSIAAIAGTFRWRNNSALLSLCLLYAVLNLPIWDWQSGLALRLGLAAVWVAMLVFVAAVGGATSPLRSAWMVVALLPVVYYGYLTTYHKEYAVERPPIPFLRENAAVLKGWLPDDTFVVAPHGIEFAASYFLRLRSSDKPPAEETVGTLATVTRSDAVGRCDRIRPGAPAPRIPIECVEMGDQYVLRIIRSSATGSDETQTAGGTSTE